jgi:acyl-CoA thioester hydrolase
MTITPNPIEFRFTLRVYWEDTDAGGVVFYANYLKYFERARTEWLRSLGIGQEDMRRNLGVMFIVTDTAVSYRRAARLDDSLDVTARLLELRKASLQVSQEVWRGAELLTVGTIRLACVDAATFKPRPLPSTLTQSLG